MRLTLYTDFALRMLMYLSLAGDQPSTIQEVASAYGISRNHLMKVAQKLGQLGFVENIRGRGGGMRLARRPEDIRLGDVVRGTEEDFRQVECFDAERNTCVLTPACCLKSILSSALSAYFDVLDQHTLADLKARPAAMRQILGLSAA